MPIPRSRLALIAAIVVAGAAASWSLRDSLKPEPLEPRPVQVDKAALEEKVWKLLDREMKRQRERTGQT